MMKKALMGLVCVALVASQTMAMRPVDGRRLPGMTPAAADLSVFPHVERAAIEDATGIPSWVSGDLGQLPRGERVTAAETYVRSLGRAFKIRPSDDFQVTRMFTDRLGETHIRVRQLHEGIPVDGADLYLHLDANGNVRVINGHIGADIETPPVPEISGQDAVAFFVQRQGVEEISLETEPQLVYYTRAEEPVFLAWRFEASWSDGQASYKERIYIDAQDGTVLDRQGLIWAAKYRKIYTANYGTSLPGSLLFTEGGSSSDSAAMAAYNNLGYTYDFYKNVFGRDSYDGSGSSLIATVHYSSNYNNAYWNGSQMVFGDGDGSTFSNLASALDVVAHELTHAVTEYTANLTYSYESGALNEATSDIMGCACEAYHDGGISSDTWKMGEDIYTPGTPGDALRYINDPAADGSSPDYYPERYTGSSDNGGVHINMGIGSLAFYLFSQGGTHPRGKTSVQVPALGLTAARAIWYRALTTYFTSSTNFEGARNATAQAAQDLYGSSAYDAVHKAWDAVGVPGTPASTTVTTLSNGQTVSGLSGASGSQTFFKIAVPSGQTSLEIKIWSGSGDCDLYVKRGAKPTTSSYDYRPYLSGNNETVTVNNPASGDWYIMLNGYEAYSGVYLKATYAGDSGGGGDTGDGVVVLTNGVAKTNLSGGQGSASYFKIAVPSGQSSLEIAISGGSGDCDLYVKRGAQPTTSSYDYRPYLTGNNETVTVDNPASGDWYIMLHGYEAYSGVTLKATYSGGSGGGGTTSMNESESNGSTSSADVISSSPMHVTAYIGSSSDVDYFRVTLPAGHTLTVDMGVPSGKDYDIKLYDSSGNRLAYGYNGTGQDEHVTYTNSGSYARYVYIKCYPYSGYSSSTPYTLDVTF